ncbi:MAG: pilus assembly protein PilM [Phycisphaerae bacterium]|nr:MAG: pilus assembly protein PilM [Phycisphaerae bacterium]
MAGPQTVWGIDVGKSAFKAVRLRAAGDGVEVVSTDYIEHSKIMSQQDADPDALWSSALEKFLAKNDITSDNIVIGVPGQQTLARFSKLPPVENKKKIPDIVRYEADQQIPFDMDEVVWDYQVFEAEGNPDVEVGIFAIKRELIRDHLVHFDSQGIEAVAVQAAPLAAYNAMHYDGLVGDNATVIIDIGTESTDLIIGTESSLWTRSIQLGGNNFTEALVKAFKLSFSKAETLKRTAATSKYARQIFQAMRPVFADLVQELQRSVGYYTATHRDVSLGKVYGMGNAFKLPGLQKYIKQNLQLDLIKIDAFSKIKLPDADGSAGDANNYSVAYGLALQGLDLSKVNSNLLPPEIALASVWKKKRPFLAASAACLLLTAGVVWFRGMSDNKTLEVNSGNPPAVTDSNAWDTILNPPNDLAPRPYGKLIYAASQNLKRQHGNLSSQGKAEIEKAEKIEKLLANRTVWIKILSAIHAALPAPPEGVKDAANAEDYVAAIRNSGLSRGKRGEIFIQSLKSQYVPNVDEASVIKGDYSEASTKIYESKGGKPRPGFIIDLKGYAPHEKDSGPNVKEKGLYVNSTFVKTLREIGRKPEQGFFINRMGLTVADEGKRGDKQPAGFQDMDPITGEPADDDYHFQVMIEVVLADLPVEEEKK